MRGGVIVQADSNNFLQKLIVGQAAVRSRIGEVFSFGNLGIWICFEQVKLSFFGQPIVEPRVATQKKIAVDAL